MKSLRFRSSISGWSGSKPRGARFRESPARVKRVRKRFEPTAFFQPDGSAAIATRGVFKGLRFAVEALFPTYQNLDGPQLETKWRLTAGLQYAF